MVRFSLIRKAKSRCGSKRTTLPLVGQNSRPLAVEVEELGALLTGPPPRTKVLDDLRAPRRHPLEVGDQRPDLGRRCVDVDAWPRAGRAAGRRHAGQPTDTCDAVSRLRDVLTRQRGPWVFSHSTGPGSVGAELADRGQRLAGVDGLERPARPPRPGSTSATEAGVGSPYVAPSQSAPQVEVALGQQPVRRPAPRSVSSVGGAVGEPRHRRRVEPEHVVDHDPEHPAVEPGDREAERSARRPCRPSRPAPRSSPAPAARRPRPGRRSRARRRRRRGCRRRWSRRRAGTTAGTAPGGTAPRASAAASTE